MPRSTRVTPHLLLLTQQPLHWARGQPLAGQQIPRGPPEASEDEEGSSSSTHSECLGLGRAQGVLLDEGGILLEEHSLAGHLVLS